MYELTLTSYDPGESEQTTPPQPSWADIFFGNQGAVDAYVEAMRGQPDESQQSSRDDDDE